jgi:hypothetical protein
VYCVVRLTLSLAKTCSGRKRTLTKEDRVLEDRWETPYFLSTVVESLACFNYQQRFLMVATTGDIVEVTRIDVARAQGSIRNENFANE